MVHVANNPIYDPFTSTKYPHWFFNMKFENEVNPEEQTPPYTPYVDYSFPNREQHLIEQAIRWNKISKWQDYDSYLHKIFPNI